MNSSKTKNMVDLNNSKLEIKDFISSSIERFQREIQRPDLIGLYCCPWAGWITINFNVNRKNDETENNCPDFEYIEYDYLELSNWANEYERDIPEFKLMDEVKRHDHNLGDEKFNQLIFKYLKPIVIELKQEYESEFLLQLLDSKMLERV